ncbi:gluconate 2-dehydrogenase subunit 3 family protein [Chloroflexota bacterium]
MSDELAWSESRKAFLNRILDEIIPASGDGRIPTGGSLGVAEYLEARAKDTPGLEEQFSRGLERAVTLAERKGSVFEELSGDDRRQMVADLKALEPDFFSALLRHTYMGYYTEPSVPPLFGLTDKAPHPYGYDVPDEDVEKLKGLVEPVKARGRCYREVR